MNIFFWKPCMFGTWTKTKRLKEEAIISCPYAGLGHCPEGQGPDTV